VDSLEDEEFVESSFGHSATIAVTSWQVLQAVVVEVELTVN
jgi:hypothetical protein